MIAAPTGSGKTYFVIHKLLPQAYREHKKILYLVNRQILKTQLEEEIGAIDDERDEEPFLDNYIKIETYQKIEACYKKEDHTLGNLHFDKTGRRIDYLYVVCDEVHYFAQDALFNPNTYISYDIIMDTLSYRKLVFISATTDDFLNTIGEKEAMAINKKYSAFWEMDNIGYIGISNIPDPQNLPETNMRYYPEKKEYTFLKIKYFRQIAELPDIISEDKKNKWLVFINDISKGKELKAELEKREEDVVFINADFADDEEEKAAVNKITADSELNNRVVIATSVLDNGVSIKDRELRNLVVLAENETEFVQMLGRKRKDGEKVNLYICSRSKLFFERRLEHWKEVQRDYSICKDFVATKNYFALYEKIFEDTGFYANVRKLLCQYQEKFRIGSGVLCTGARVELNRFSEYALEKQEKECRRIIRKFKEGDKKAFLRTQLEWIGVPESEVELVISKMQEEEKENLEKRLTILLDGVVGKPYDKKAKKKFSKDSLREDLASLVELIMGDEYTDKVATSIKRPDEGISRQTFNEMMRITGLPFCMEMKKAEGNGIFYIRRTTEELKDISEPTEE